MKKITTSCLALLSGIGVGTGIGLAAIEKKKGELNSLKKVSDKHLALFMLMNEWVRIKQQGKSLRNYFENNKYKKIAIYGMSYVGETLLDELRDSDICVMYGIDKNADQIYADINLFTMDAELEEVDAIIVTAITYYDDIADELEKKVNCPIISLEDIIYEML